MANILVRHMIAELTYSEPKKTLTLAVTAAASSAAAAFFDGAAAFATGAEYEPESESESEPSLLYSGAARIWASSESGSTQTLPPNPSGRHFSAFGRSLRFSSPLSKPAAVAAAGASTVASAARRLSEAPFAGSLSA
eukprot:4874407-Prymnesium_polylepis.4